MTTELTARERFEYDKKVVFPGQDFEATEMHARILVSGGRATYKTRDIHAGEARIAPSAIESATAARDEPEDEKPKRGGRRYARRDMQADET